MIKNIDRALSNTIVYGGVIMIGVYIGWPWALVAFSMFWNMCLLIAGVKLTRQSKRMNAEIYRLSSIINHLSGHKG